jgi:hypothetical protein
VRALTANPALAGMAAIRDEAERAKPFD